MSRYLLNIQSKENTVIIIDEIGKLELKEKGLYESLMHHLQVVRTNNFKLLLVVRDSLLDEVKLKFGVSDATVITVNDIESTLYL